MSPFAPPLMLLFLGIIVSNVWGVQQPTRVDTTEKRQTDRTKFAATNLREVDEDFAYQGEYLGFVPPGFINAEMAGLQVLALGDGEFEAVLLHGGLPAAGWDRWTKEKLAGKREHKTVVLRGKRHSVSVGGQAAVLRDASGRPWAKLPKLNRVSPTLDLPPAPGATVLFDGISLAHFRSAQFTRDGYLAVGAITKANVRDFQMHLEFRTPYMPNARGQGRGNSGVYIQQRYEVQILDSFGLEGADNECGGLYRQKRPNVNMCLPPLSWQTYDIFFTAARWGGKKKLANAQITVLHNGEPVHLDYSLTAKTGGGKAEGPEDLPILLQNHGNPVTFRNIWLVSLKPVWSEPAFCGPQDFLDAGVPRFPAFGFGRRSRMIFPCPY